MEEIKDYIDRSVLCWLATSSAENFPNVSPKEIFAFYGSDKIIIANIASPQSIRNIREHFDRCNPLFLPCALRH
ncbi:MAG: pyridoxamine 5'-phosphate oxidase family protein [Bacteroidota bacterium]